MHRAADTGLPIETAVAEVLTHLRTTRRCVLTAEPGAGKTTVIPLRLADTEWIDGRVLVLEPRRLAARAAARRMSDLVGDRLGGHVGVTTRHDRAVSSATRIEVVTDGILTRRIQNDPTLDGVAAVIFDEFHERHMTADLGLALTLDAVEAVRPDLSVLVMSATLDAPAVAALIGSDGPAPIVESPGRTHPVDIIWRPRTASVRIEEAAADAIVEALAMATDGDVLVFLPGAGAIRKVERLLAGRLSPDTDVHPLFGALAPEAQDAAIAPCRPGRRKVVLSTDIAESSLTVEGVTVVVDWGAARRPQLDVRTGMGRLTTITSSRASADQRAGRAGRVRPGTAIRLWSKVEHASRTAHERPEITRADLAGLALEFAAWSVDDPSELALLDPPPGPALSEAKRLLRTLGAIDETDRPTTLGHEMLRLPLHPRLARMVVEAGRRGDGWTACCLAAILEEGDVLGGRPGDIPADVDERLALLDDPGRRHPAARGAALQTARRRAGELARRQQIPDVGLSPSRAGALLALAYPDRVGVARGRAGTFRLRSGAGAWVDPRDPLAGSAHVVAADLDGRRSDARIRIGAAVELDDLVAAAGGDVEVTQHLKWDSERDDLYLVSDRRLDHLLLGADLTRPVPGEETTAALLARVTATRLRVLRFDDRALQLQARLEAVRSSFGDAWPDVTDRALLSTLDTWLAPFLLRANSKADLEAIDVAMAISSTLDFDRQMELDQLAPTTWTPPHGRPAPIDWTRPEPTVSVRAQALFGTSEHPTVLGGTTALLVEVLSPADRPVQITGDLPAFWAGSWSDVRKDMAGRYPKHEWPADPGSGFSP